MIIKETFQDLDTPSGLMRTYIYQPQAEGRYPAIILYSEIFQQTGPIKRAAAMYAGHGFVVAVPEIFHELEPIGEVLNYDQAGADRGNSNKIKKTIESYDSDTKLLIAFLKDYPACNGRIGAVGICIGGHLSFRAAMNSEILGAACFYATDIHKRSLGKGMNDNSLERIPDIKGELMMIWGRQDPHISEEGRRVIQNKLEQAETRYTWHEFNAAHAFMRDEGQRYDPELSLICYNLVIGFMRRVLA